MQRQTTKTRLHRYPANVFAKKGKRNATGVTNISSYNEKATVLT